MIRIWLLALSLWCLPGMGATINAASCNSSAVQTAVNSAASGDTVVIPAGTCTWTAAVSWVAPANTILQGAGNSSTGGGDLTVIVDSYANSNPLLNITTNISGTFRLTGITFQGGNPGVGNDKNNGQVVVGGSSSSIRVDHVHFNTTTYMTAQSGSQSLEFIGCTYGVVDHSLFDNSMIPLSVNNSIRVFNQGSCNGDALGVGDQAWTLPSVLGTYKAIFAEDNVFNGGASNDCYDGASMVWRHNIMNTNILPVNTHGTAGARHRGCRSYEIYVNTFNAGNNFLAAGINLDSGTGVIWGNTIPNGGPFVQTGYSNVITAHVKRYDNATYTESPPPTGWGYCGTHQTGVTSAWDQNISSDGYACIDQIGRGMGQLLVLDFPNTKNNFTGTIAWPNQVLQPVYEWLSAYSPVFSNPSHIWTSADPLTVANRDYYLGTTDAGTPISFNGTVGVGSGLLSARPATCTPLVAYWATDTTILYQCTSANTWTAYYTPYPYPHPLVVTPLPAPGNPRLVVN